MVDWQVAPWLPAVDNMVNKAAIVVKYVTGGCSIWPVSVRSGGTLTLPANALPSAHHALC